MKQKEINSIFECLDIAEESTGDGTGIQLARRLIGLMLGIKPSSAKASENGACEGQGGVDEDDPPSPRQQDALDALKQLQADDGDMTVKGVAEAMEAEEDNVQILLAGLFGKGHVTRHREEGTKAYIYTPKAA